MTNFILRDPDVVFVHVPKTGGTSVKTALGGTIEQRFFGHIPDSYANWSSFAIIRDPRARFLSAFRMFKYGADAQGDYYGTPRWPDLTITRALDVLEDPWIGFDRSQRQLDWNLKHHLLPQTHPFNCLQDAKRLLRFERLEEEFALFCQDLGVAITLPSLRRSHTPPGHEDSWTPSDEDRFQQIFAADYATLGYEPPHLAATNAPAVPSAPDPIFALWPSYFSDRKIKARRAEAALPAPDAPLEPFVDSIIPGSPAPTWAGREGDLNAHFHKLQPEFSGASRLAHLLACVVVVLRRNETCEVGRHLFWRILEEQFESIQAEISLRWLVAVSDTMADHGRDDTERATALTASILVNTCKLHETELSVFYPPRPWPPKARVAPGGALFDGMITYWTEKGDLIDNMFSRSAAAANRSPVAGQVLLEVMERLRRGPTVYRRFDRIAGQPPVPLLSDDIERRMRRMMNRRL